MDVKVIAFQGGGGAWGCMLPLFTLPLLLSFLLELGKSFLLEPGRSFLRFTRLWVGPWGGGRTTFGALLI